jgi:ferritin-like metal-binding protein YciE
VNKDQMHSLLLEALETELCGVLVYETALKCALNPDLKEEWQEYLGQTENHVSILTGVLKKLGINPETEIPNRVLIRLFGQGLVNMMVMALQSGKPEAAQMAAAECVVHAETKDHGNWQLIGILAEKLGGTDQQVLRKAYDEVEDEEDEHLYHTAGWLRELQLEALDLPAQLPPPEEKKDVKTALAAATTQKERKESLAKTVKGKR